VRANGYALDLEEFEVGLRCIAAPVRDQSARVIAALGIAGPRSRLEDARLAELVPVVVDAADRLSRNLGFVQDHGLAPGPLAFARGKSLAAYPPRKDLGQFAHGTVPC